MKCPRCGDKNATRLYKVGFTKQIEGNVSGPRTRFKREVCIDCVSWFQREVDRFVSRLEKAVGVLS